MKRIKTELRLPSEMKEKLKKEADKKNISLNQLIINILEESNKATH